MRCEIVALYHFTYLMSNFYSLDKVHYQNAAKTALFSMIYYLRKKFFHIDNCILNSRAAISFSKIQNFSARLLLYCKIKRKLARVTVLRTFPSPYGDLSARYLSYRQVRTTKKMHSNSSELDAVHFHCPAFLFISSKSLFKWIFCSKFIYNRSCFINR